MAKMLKTPDCLETTICWFININQLDALNFYNKFISSLHMFRAHVLIVRRAKIVLYSLWYHHTYRCEFSASSWLILIYKYIEMHGQLNIKQQ